MQAKTNNIRKRKKINCKNLDGDNVEDRRQGWYILCNFFTCISSCGKHDSTYRFC